MKNKQLNENIVTQRQKKKKPSQHLENGILDQNHYKGSRNYHKLKDQNANDLGSLQTGCVFHEHVVRTLRN